MLHRPLHYLPPMTSSAPNIHSLLYVCYQGQRLMTAQLKYETGKTKRASTSAFDQVTSKTSGKQNWSFVLLTMPASICKIFTCSLWTREFYTKCFFMCTNVWTDLDQIILHRHFLCINKAITTCVLQRTLHASPYQNSNQKDWNLLSTGVFLSPHLRYGTHYHPNSVLLLR